MKGKTIGIASLLITAMVATGAFAFGGLGNNAARDAIESGDYSLWKEAHTNELTEERFEEARERHQQMEQRRVEMDEAIEEGYSAWKEYMEENSKGKRILEVINEDNFDEFVEMHELRIEGDFESAKEIAEELGLNGFHRQGKRGNKFGKMGGCPAE